MPYILKIPLPTFSACKADALLIFWNLGFIATVLLPIVFFSIGRSTVYYYEDEREEEDQATGYYDQYGNWVQYQQRHWWQFWISDEGYRRQQEGNQRSQDENEVRIPWWYVWGGEREPEEEGQGTVMFVYIYLLLILTATVVYGNATMANSSAPTSKLQSLMLGFANLCFLVPVLLGGLDAVKVDGREIEETGFYGQKSMLLFMTCIFGMFYSIISMVWIGKRIKNSANSAVETQAEGDYKLHEMESTTEESEKTMMV
jgi:hypothetical protein